MIMDFEIFDKLLITEVELKDELDIIFYSRI